jgi:3-oxoadipate enol-lactonase/4-carboxymuconolactone decarboxylase
MEMWDPQLTMLAGHFRVLRYDQRGHGRSPAQPGPYTIDDLGRDALQLLDLLGFDRVSVCGVSLGGMIAMWLAINAPDRVDRVALCCTAPHLPPAQQWRDRAAAVRGSGTAQLVEATLGRWFTPSFPSQHPAVGEQITAMLSSTDDESYASCCEAIAAMDLRDDLKKITAPTLIIGGADDPVVPPVVATDMQQAIPGSALTIIAGAAHLANIEQSGRFNAAVFDHLTGGSLTSGLTVRRQVLGDEHVERAMEQASPITAAFQDLITRYAWGEIWTRPGLDRRTRSCVTIAMLVALGRMDELELHLRATRRNGLSDAEIIEVLLQTAIYCGVPAANSAFAVARRVLSE